MMRDLIFKLIKHPLVLFGERHWVIGIIFDYINIDSLIKRGSNISWLKAKHKQDFIADPFITSYFGEKIVFFEYYHGKKQLGDISYLRLSEINSNKKNINQIMHSAISLSTHLSFPYLFEFENELYMIPENYQSNNISLYKSENSPDKWNKIKTIIHNFSGVDTVIFQYNNKWWLISTCKTENPTDEFSTLYIWYSESPLGDWTPHKLNPIRYEHPVARNAGTPFEYNGKLYRPSQDCTRTYGGELLINEVIDLTPEKFSEKSVLKSKGYRPYNDAFHTINSCGNITVIDGAGFHYSLKQGYNKLRELLQSIQRRY